MKLYLVWNEAKTECVGFTCKEAAYYACHGAIRWIEEHMAYTDLADEWHEIYGDEECTITEIEV